MINNKVLSSIYHNCEVNPEHTAIDYEGRILSYADLKLQIEKNAGKIQKIGINSGHRVAVVISHKVEFIVMWLACWQSRCIPIPIEPALKSHDLEQAVLVSQCNYLISDQPSLRENINLKIVKASMDLDIYDVFASNKETDELSLDTSLNFYTSGTTGLPKCVQFSHSSIYENILAICNGLNLLVKDIMFTPLSPSLPAILTTAVLPVLCAGATLVMSQHAIPSKVFEIIKTKSVTVFFAVPYLYAMLNESVVSSKGVSWDNLRLCISSSANLDFSIIDEFYKMTGISIRSLYCSSEGGAIAYNSSNDKELVKHSVGKAHPGVCIKLLDSMQNQVQIGETGELWVSGNKVAIGYFQQPLLQEEVFKDGWVKTGDLFTLDSEGNLYICGRVSDTINVSGYLVNPLEVEQIIMQHEQVKDVIIFGVKDKYSGEKIFADIVSKGGDVTSEDILIFCSERMAHYKVPRIIEWVNEIPTGRYGKRLRNYAQTASKVSEL